MGIHRLHPMEFLTEPRRVALESHVVREEVDAILDIMRQVMHHLDPGTMHVVATTIATPLPLTTITIFSNGGRNHQKLFLDVLHIMLQLCPRLVFFTGKFKTLGTILPSAVPTPGGGGGCGEGANDSIS